MAELQSLSNHFVFGRLKGTALGTTGKCCLDDCHPTLQTHMKIRNRTKETPNPSISRTEGFHPHKQLPLKIIFQ